MLVRGLGVVFEALVITKNSMIDVLIIAAGSIKNKTHFIKHLFSSPALVPINSRNVVSYIIDFYKSYPVKSIYIAINKEDYPIVSRELSYYQDLVCYILIEKSTGVVDTLIQCLTQQRFRQDVIVNLVTTIPTVFAKNNEVQIANYKDKNNHYSRVAIKGRIVKFYKKRDQYRHAGAPFCGIIRFSESVLRGICYKRDMILDDFVQVVEMIAVNHQLHFREVEWIDVGHEVNYFRAKTKLLSGRTFNAIKVDRGAGVLEKTSLNHQKLVNEINFIKMLPAEISIFFPRIIKNVEKISNSQSKVTMEYYGYPNLAEYLLYWDLDEILLGRIFQAIGHFLTQLKQYRYSLGVRAYLDFYFTRTQQRVGLFSDQLKQHHLQKYITAPKLIINQKTYDNISLLYKRIARKIEAMYDEADFCIMHGDLCFNNILFDIQNEIIRLIDARGSFGEKCIGIYGDIKYDLAKITHSGIGCYDYIVSDLFFWEIKNKSFNYEFNLRPNYPILKTVNLNLIKEFGYNYKDIMFLVGLLFVSMCALHHDNVKRQMVMYMHGIKILNESLIS